MYQSGDDRDNEDKVFSLGSNRYHFKISIYTMSLRHGGEVPQTQKSKIPSAENPKAVKAFFFMPELGQDIALRVPPAARKCVVLISAFWSIELHIFVVLLSSPIIKWRCDMRKRLTLSLVI